MKTALEAKNTSALTLRGIVQNVNIGDGITLDQDGNSYPSQMAKYNFLKSCLSDGIRSGNLQPITTGNQCADLIKRINDAAHQCGQPEISPADEKTEIDYYTSVEEVHRKSESLMQYFRREILQSGICDTAPDRNAAAQVLAWRKVYSMTNEEIIAATK